MNTHLPGKKTEHLSETEFTDTLLGLNENPGVQAHLASCEVCRAELTRFEEAIGIFRETSNDWAQQRVASIPAPQPGFLARFGLSLKPVMGIAAAALAVAIAVPFLQHNNVPLQQAAIEHHAPVPTAAEITSDNELLEAINDEISAPRTNVQQAFVDPSISTPQQ